LNKLGIQLPIILTAVPAAKEFNLLIVLNRRFMPSTWKWVRQSFKGISLRFRSICSRIS